MKKYTLFLILLFTVFTSIAQNTLYFMDHLPQKQFFNPAMMPEVKFYLFLPGINGMSFNAYNSGFTFTELDHFLKNLDRPGYDPDEFIHSIGKNNRFISEMKANLFGFGFRISELDLLSFNIASYHTLILDAKPEIAYLLTDFDAIEEVKFPIVVEGIDLNTNNYMVFGINYVRKMNEYLTIGINPNINYNIMALKTSNLKYIVDMEYQEQYMDFEYSQTFSGEAVLGLPFPINPAAVSGGELDLNEGILPANWDKELRISDLLRTVNFSFNLGATYQLNKWDFSASLLNIGTSGWKRNAYHFKGTDDVIKVSEEKIRIGIPPKVYLGAARQFLPKWNYGIMMENTFYPGRLLSSATLSLNGALGRVLSTSFSYTAGYKFDNFGLGFRLRFFPGVDLFFVTDNLIQVINYKRSHRISGAVGINIELGTKRSID